jgi:beta-aspartyl-peptidase (threonine type)
MIKSLEALRSVEIGIGLFHMKKEFGIVVHGGAGKLARVSRSDLSKRRAKLVESASEGFKIMHFKGGSATDAVESAINVLESSKLFNAGLGSCLTLEGQVRMDAAIMNGDLSCGAIADQSLMYKSISLARKVMEESDHVLMVGNDSLRKFCDAIGYKTAGFEVGYPSRAQISRFNEFLKLVGSRKYSDWKRNTSLFNKYLLRNPVPTQQTGTVGCVALDADGKLCSGVSTGGRWMKLPGRVGDSAIVGAGLYACNSTGAVSATGAGEEIIRICLSKMVSDFMRDGLGAQLACEIAIKVLSKTSGNGTGGLIAIDKDGGVGRACNTEVLPTAVRLSSIPVPLVVISKEERLSQLLFSKPKGKANRQK